jgi:hypothetical protein
LHYPACHPEPTEWQHVGNEINAVALISFRNSKRTTFPRLLRQQDYG